MAERLQKILAAAGIASRRKAEELIATGHVSVNGQVVTTLGAKADLGCDTITVDGQKISRKERKTYVLLNKPVGYVCTVTDTHGRPTVLDLLPNRRWRLFPVGRLDIDTSGLLILTNDGAFTQQILHPANRIDKVYRVKVKGMPTPEEIKSLCNGITVDEIDYKADRMRFLTRKGRESLWEVTLHEGKKRQIRHMFEEIAHPVNSLERIRIGTLERGELKVGEWRFLKNSEVKTLLKQGNKHQSPPGNQGQVRKKPHRQRKHQHGRPF